MPQSEMPTMRSRRLGTELRRLRESKGLTTMDAARELQCGQPKISKIETGHRGIRPLDLTHLMDLYGVTDPQHRENLRRLAKQIHQRDWWMEHGPLLNDHLKDYLVLETDAGFIRSFACQVMPGLLQTEDYMRAIFTEHQSPEKTELLVDMRLQRQKILDGPEPTRYWAVIDEAILIRPLVKPTIRAKQLRHVLDMADRPNVNVQVYPLTAAAPPDTYPSYTILTMRESAGIDYVWVEHLTGSMALEQEQFVEPYRRAWENHTSSALPRRDSLDYLYKLLKE
ncbi:helix-turn-helix domain-containing protein [Allostreptomyces psammosilenae]|uniref:Transcriptional regulator with XRE-family HTH domain n=1 Tax=Allostreptomyces psammosilenae TaxID=1892865 RepID=A0A852ZZT4_9ACTN|nr:helix-turn-helix transcriptional regulator [Allostreptomyces psammosilenae]NYI07846.1 transcriptional regulator with XRE-family HTH domain [Allostreptomyces psammosilenae]